MRGQLIVIYVTLLFLLVVGVNLPLAVTIVGDAGDELLSERHAEAARFASAAAPALAAGQGSSLRTALRQYDERLGVAVVVVPAAGRPVVASRSGIDLVAGEVADVLARALTGIPAHGDRTIYPWQRHSLVVAEPVVWDAEITGAVVSLSPDSELRATILRRWALQAGASIAVLLAGAAAAAVPTANRTLRPIDRLNQALRGFAAGRWSGQTLPVTGPPELRRLAWSFTVMAKRLAVQLERQHSFASYASHQLRAPLATLRLWLDNLAPSVPPHGQADLRLVSAEIDRLGELCAALLAYAQADVTAGDVADLDAADVADARVAVWSQAARQAGVRLVRSGGRRAWVWAAPQALDQALDALLSNAVRYAGRGSQVVVTVTTLPRMDGSGARWVDVDVVDDGPGLPRADLDQATQPFWRAQAHQNADGSGLGLSIVKALVVASGGQLDLRPAVPNGVHARIRLPAAQAASGMAGGSTAATPSDIEFAQSTSDPIEV